MVAEEPGRQGWIVGERRRNGDEEEGWEAARSATEGWI